MSTLRILYAQYKVFDGFNDRACTLALAFLTLAFSLQKVKEYLASKLKHFIFSLRELGFLFAFAHSKHLPQKMICVGRTVLNLLNLIAKLVLHSCRQLFLQTPKNILIVNTFALVVFCHGEVRTI